MSSSDNSASPPRFTSFPQVRDTEASNIAGPSRRPPPTFSSFPAAAAPCLTVKASKEDRSQSHRRTHKHRTRHHDDVFDRRDRHRDFAKSSRDQSNEDNQSGRDSHCGSRKERDKKGQTVGDVSHRYTPYINNHTDTVSRYQGGGPIAHSRQGLDRSGLLS